MAELEKAASGRLVLRRRAKADGSANRFGSVSLPASCSRMPRRKLGFNVRRTMGVAQRLYEGVEVGAEGSVGLITYMRTDSPRCISGGHCRRRVDWIHFYAGGTKYLRGQLQICYKGKKDAQDAHEAIRPTDVNRTPDVDCASI